MLKSKIPFQNIGSIPQLIKDFLNQEIPQFSSYKFSLENAIAQAEKKSKTFSKGQRDILVGVLKKQLQCLQLADKQSQNIELLSQQNTFTIVTGHQLNLFSGPVFFIYKILQTIKTADFLNQNSDKKFVPVFWMATEDHDFDEINHFKTANNFYQINGKSGGAVGRIIIEDTAFIEEFEKEFKDDVFGTQLILLMKKSYQKGKTLTEATRNLVHELFSEYGLLMIDGDDLALKSQMDEIYSNELKHQVVYHFSKENVDFLTQKYGKVQVNPRDINLFYLSETRERISAKGDNFEIVDTHQEFSFEQLSEDWAKISPNALLRPIFQEKVLPNIAYIGGNAEIMYWLELPMVFERFNLPFPILIPRNSMLFLREKTLKKIEKSGMELPCFFGNFQSKLNEKLLKDSELKDLVNEKEEILKTQFLELKEKSALTDKTFRNLVEAEEKRQLKSFERMKKRLLRAEKIKQADHISYLENIFYEIHPNGNWQERVLNFSDFFAENGSQWLENCYQEMDVVNSMLILMEN